MSTIDNTSRATAVGVGSKNVIFSTAGLNLTRKVVVVGTYDPAKATVVDEVPVQILNEGDAGDRFGFGFQLHRLIKAVFEGNGGAGEVWAVPQSESGGAAASEGDITWVGTTTAAGTIYIRIGGKLYQVAIPSGSGPEDISDAVVAELNADADIPVVVATTAVTFETTFTAKSKGPEGDNISITLNREDGESLPAGITSATIQAMGVVTPGTGIPDIDDALDGMGTGDDANEKFFTHLVHGYGLDTSTIDKVSAYVGEGNTFNGLYSKLITRPLMCLMADTDPGSSAYTALKAITDARLEDRANGVLGVPDDDDIPIEIAARAIGLMAKISQANPAQNYAKQVLVTEGGSVSAQRWTKDYSIRDSAVKAGISPTRVISDTTYLQNVITFFRPASIPVVNNAFSSMRSLAIIQDVGAFLRTVFESDAWTGISIVADKSLVTDFDAKQKARDLTDVQTEVNNISDFLASKSWSFDADFAKENSTISIRAASNGFDIDFKWKLSGEAQVYNIQSSFDINIAS